MTGLCIILSLVDDEVTGRCFGNLSLLVAAGLGSTCWWSARGELLPLGGGFSICKTAQGHGSGCYLQPLRRN